MQSEFTATEKDTILEDRKYRETEIALIKMVEWTIATVEGLADRSKPPTGDLNRQITIADTGLDHIRNYSIDVYKDVNRCQRVQDLLAAGKTVRQEADAIMAQNKRDLEAKQAPEVEGP